MKTAGKSKNTMKSNLAAYNLQPTLRSNHAYCGLATSHHSNLTLIRMFGPASGFLLAGLAEDNSQRLLRGAVNS